MSHDRVRMTVLMTETSEFAIKVDIADAQRSHVLQRHRASFIALRHSRDPEATQTLSFCFCSIRINHDPMLERCSSCHVIDGSRSAPMIIKDRKKLITFDGDVLQALEAYSRRTGSSLRTILSEAAREWLAKKGQPVGLKAALTASARAPANEDSKASVKSSRSKTRAPKS